MADFILNAVSERISTVCVKAIYSTFLTSSATANESQIVEARYLIFHDGRSVAEFGGEVLIIACSDRDENSIGNITERNNFECNR